VLTDFYAQAGLDVPSAESSTLAIETLLWGLARLEEDSIDPPLPAGWRAWCGADDALLDAARLHAIEPAVTIVGGATHHPAGLLRAFAEECSGAHRKVERVAPNPLVRPLSQLSVLGATRSTREGEKQK
jgi:hypothetical protein